MELDFAKPAAVVGEAKLERAGERPVTHDGEFNMQGFKGSMRPSLAAAPAAAKPTKATKVASTTEKAKREFAAVNPAPQSLFNADGSIKLVQVQLTDRDGKPKVSADGKPVTRLMPARLSRTDFTKGAEGRKLYFTYTGRLFLWRAENGPRGPQTEEEKLERQANALLQKLEAVKKQKAELAAKRAAK